MVKSATAMNHDVLSHLDQIFPFLSLEDKTLQEIEERFEKARSPESLLEFWCVREDELASFLQLETGMVSFLLKHHRFLDEEEKTWKVNPLDIMTTLVLFMKSNWPNRLKYLFRWYNTSQTGLLEEEEHFYLIRGVARCLRKLKMVGTLDVTDADAHQLALEARLMFDDENIPHLRPGLFLDDLVDWLLHSPFCKILLDFYDILNRLVDMLKTLDARSASLLSMMEQRTENRRIDLPTAQYWKQPGVSKLPHVIVTHLRSTHLSVVFPSEVLLHGADVPGQFPELFAVVERRIYVETEHYNIEEPIIQRQQPLQKARHAPHINCCHKYITESNVRQLHKDFGHWFARANATAARAGANSTTVATYRDYVALRGSDANQGLQRYELDDLLPGTEYDVSIYSKHVQFGRIDVKTLPHDERLAADAPPSSSVGGGGLCIFPSSVNRLHSIRQHIDLIQRQNSDQRLAIVLTGSLVSAADVLQQYLFPQLEALRWLPKRALHQTETVAMLHHLQASLLRAWKQHGFEAVQSVFHVTQTPLEEVGDVPVLGLSGQTQLLYFNGDGPLASSHYCTASTKRALKRGFWRRWLHQIAAPVHERFARTVVDRLERLYAQRIASQVAPLTGSASPLEGVGVFMTAPASASYFDPLTHTTLKEIAHAIEERSFHEALRGRASAATTPTHRYVILVRDPSDLLVDGPIGAVDATVAAAAGSAAVPGAGDDCDAELAADGQENREEVPAQRLFGKYELVHGEYTREKTTADADADTDADGGVAPPKKRPSVMSEPPLPSYAQQTRAAAHATNVRIEYHPPPRAALPPNEHFSAPGYEANSAAADDEAEAEAISLPIVNLAACESYLEPVDAFWLHASCPFASHPALHVPPTQSPSETESAPDGAAHAHAAAATAAAAVEAEQINWNERLMAAWRDRLPPHCALVYEDDTDTRSLHLQRRATAHGGSECVLSLPRCLKEDEVDVVVADEDQDAVAEFWQSSFGWDVTQAHDAAARLTWATAGTSEAVSATPSSAGSLASSHHGSFAGSVALPSAKGGGLLDERHPSAAARRGKAKKKASSSAATAPTIAQLYQRWDVPQFLLSHGCNALPRLASRLQFAPNHARGLTQPSPAAVGRSDHAIPFHRVTLYRPVLPHVAVGLAVRRFRSTAVDESSVTVTLEASGWGRLQCGLLAVPANATFADAWHLLHIAPKTTLQRAAGRLQDRWVHHVGQLGVSATPLSFRFDGLCPGTKYAAFLWYASLHTVGVAGQQVGSPWGLLTATAAAAATAAHSNNSSAANVLTSARSQASFSAGAGAGGGGSGGARDLRLIRDVVLVTTRYRVSAQPIPRVSFVFAPFTAADFTEAFHLHYEAPRLRMLHQLLDQFRFAYPAVEVAAVTSDEAAVANDAIRCSPQVPGVARLLAPTWREGVGRPQPAAHETLRSDLPSSSSSSSSGGADLQPSSRGGGLDGVYAQYVGPFCVLKMQSDRVDCLAAAAAFLDGPELNFVPPPGAASRLVGYPTEAIRVLVVITAHPLVPQCFRVRTTDHAGRGLHVQGTVRGDDFDGFDFDGFDGDGGGGGGGGHSHAARVTIAWWRAVCAWQVQRVGRDVRVLTAGHVPQLLCVHVHRRLLPPPTLPGLAPPEDDASVDRSGVRPPENSPPPPAADAAAAVDGDQSPAKSIASKKTLQTAVSALTAASSAADVRQSPAGSLPAPSAAGRTAHGRSSTAASVDVGDGDGDGGDSLSTKPLPRRRRGRAHDAAAAAERLPFWVFPAAGERHAIAADVHFVVSVFDEAKSARRFRPTRDEQALWHATKRQRDAAEQLAPQGPQPQAAGAAVSSGQSVASMSLAPSLASSTSLAAAAASFESFCSFHPAHHRWYMDPPGPSGSGSSSGADGDQAPTRRRGREGPVVGRFARRLAYEPLPVVHLLDFVLPALPGAAPGDNDGDSDGDAAGRSYRALPLTLRGLRQDALFAASGGALPTQLHHNHRVFHFPPKLRYLLPPPPGPPPGPPSELPPGPPMAPRCWLFAQQVATSMDLLRVVVGPVVGQVTQQSARVLFEFNATVALPAALRQWQADAAQQQPRHELRLVSHAVRCRLRSCAPMAAPAFPSALSLAAATTTTTTPTTPTTTAASGGAETDASPPSRSVDVWLDRVEAFQPVVFSFAQLAPDTRYEVFLPDLFPGRVLGALQTLPWQAAASLDLLITADRSVAVALPIVDDFLRELATVDAHTALPDVEHALRWNQWLYNLRGDDLRDLAASAASAAPAAASAPSMWHYLADAIEEAATTTARGGVASVVHIAPLSPLVAAPSPSPSPSLSPSLSGDELLWQRFAPLLHARCEAVLRSALPPGAAGGAAANESLELLQQFQLQALEQLVRDTFRLILSTPAVAAAMASAAHLFVHHPRYLLPVDNAAAADAAQGATDDGAADEAATAAIAAKDRDRVLRRMFDHQVQLYVHSLFDPAAGAAAGAAAAGAAALHRRRHPAVAKAKDAFRDWRQGGVVVALVDVLSQRLKRRPPKPSTRAPQRSTAPPTAAPTAASGDGPPPDADADADGLVIRQWQRLRVYGGDNTIVHLVVVFPQPLIALTRLRDAPLSAAETTLAQWDDNDEAVAWAPTAQDVDTFCRFWVDWMRRVQRETGGRETKSVVFVSSAPLPYATLIQDLRSGCKLFQLCVGDGRIGASLRYVHQLRGQDCVRTEPSGLLSTATAKSSGSEPPQPPALLLPPPRPAQQPTPPVDAATTAADEGDAADAKPTATATATKKATKKKAPKATAKAKGPAAATAAATTATAAAATELAAVATARSPPLPPVARGGRGNVGFARLRLFVDQWNPVATWHNANLRDLFARRHDRGDAVLLLGPLLGAPFVKPPPALATGAALRRGRRTRRASSGPGGEAPPRSLSMHETPLYVPMLLEVDRRVTLRIDARGTFTQHHLVAFHAVTQPERPFVVVLGPLHRHDRYRVRFTSGLQAASLALQSTGGGGCGHPREFVVQTHYHRDESSFAVVNVAAPRLSGDGAASATAQRVTPSTAHCTDLRQRGSVAFHGVHSVVVAQWEPPLAEALRRLQQDARLREGVVDCRAATAAAAAAVAPAPLCEAVARVLHTLRARYRDVFAGPSIRDVLRLHTALLVPALRYDPRHAHHTEHQWPTAADAAAKDVAYRVLRRAAATTAAAEDEPLDAAVERLLHLCDAFVRQEYVDRLRFPDAAVHRVLLPVDERRPPPSGDLWRSLRALPQRPVKPPATAATATPAPVDRTAEALVVAWRCRCVPAPTVFVPYHSLNRKAAVERLRSLATPAAVHLATRQFVRDTIWHRYAHHQLARVVPPSATPEGNTTGPSMPLASVSTPFWQRVHDWQRPFAHRQLRLVVPLVGHGTRRLDTAFVTSDTRPVAPSATATTTATAAPSTAAAAAATRRAARGGPPPVPQLLRVTQPLTYFLCDSVYRANEYDRRHRIAELEKAMHRKQLTAAAAKSKRAQQKKAEEERQQRQAIAQQVNDVLATQRPDGYLFVHCHTVAVLTPVETTFTAAEATAAGGGDGSGGSGGSGGGVAEAKSVAPPAPTDAAQATVSPRAAVAAAAAAEPSASAKDGGTARASSRGAVDAAPAPRGGLVIIDTVGGTVSTAAPVPASTAARSPSAASAAPAAAAEAPGGLLDRHGAQRDDLTIVSVEICGDTLPLQLAYEQRQLEERARQDDAFARGDGPDPATLPPPVPGAVHVQQLLRRRRYDHVQYPPWFLAYFPADRAASAAAFCVDEVMLLLRQQPKTLALLRALEAPPPASAEAAGAEAQAASEGGAAVSRAAQVNYHARFVARYERSRLSELSRPEDLREVDMTSPEVVGAFFYDLVRSVWQEELPNEMKGAMMSLQDPFVVGYIASRAFRPPSATAAATALTTQPLDDDGGVAVASIRETLQTAQGFARGMRQMCLYAMAMKMARDMSRLRRYEYLTAHAVDPAVVAVTEREITDRLIDKATRRRHAERAATKQLKAILTRLAAGKSLADAASTTVASATANAATRAAKGSGAGGSGGGGGAKAAAVDNKAAAAAEAEPDPRTMDVEAVREKRRQEDADDELLAAAIANIHEQRAAQIDYESDVEELIKERGKWEQETMLAAVDGILETLVAEAVETFSESFFNELVEANIAPVTAEERTQWAALHMQRLAEERRIYRRIYGQRSNPLGL
eukprot:gene7623-5480_t